MSNIFLVGHPFKIINGIISFNAMLNDQFSICPFSKGMPDLLVSYPGIFGG